MTVAELHTRMTNAEFVHWEAYHARIAQRRELEQLKAGRGR